MEQNKYISKISDKGLEELMMIVKSVIHGIDIKKLYDVARKAGRNKNNILLIKSICSFYSDGTTQIG